MSALLFIGGKNEEVASKEEEGIASKWRASLEGEEV